MVFSSESCKSMHAGPFHPFSIGHTSPAPRGARQPAPPAAPCPAALHPAAHRPAQVRPPHPVHMCVLNTQSLTTRLQQVHTLANGAAAAMCAEDSNCSGMEQDCVASWSRVPSKRAGTRLSPLPARRGAAQAAPARGRAARPQPPPRPWPRARRQRARAPPQPAPPT